MVRLCSALCVFAVSGCGLILDFDPPDMPESRDASFDASSIDASSQDADADLVADAAVSDADSGGTGFDASHRDANIDSDAPLDAALPPDSCDDELGLCVRMSDDIVPEVTGFRSNVYWTESDGTIAESGWTLDTCEGGTRSIAPSVIDCHINMRDLPSNHDIFFYPITSAGAACTFAACAGFWESYTYWFDGASIPSAPGLGPVSLERRITPDGMIMAIRYTIP